jgi:isochorismate synthase
VDLSGGPIVDLVAATDAGGVLFSSPGRTLAGWGVAAVLPLERGLDDDLAVRAIGEWLAAVSSEGPAVPSAAGAVAFGALPFDRSAPASLIVPRVLYGSDANRRWATLVAPAAEVSIAALDEAVARIAGAAGPDGPAPVTTTIAPGSLPIRPLPEPGDYAKAVQTAVEAIAQDLLDKVVLSRSVDVGVPPAMALAAAIRRLHEQEPSCTAFALPLDPSGRGVSGSGTGMFVGASPELLVERHGSAVRCHPLAGTTALVGRADDDRRATDALLASEKNLREHSLVVEAIADELQPRCTSLSVPSTPSLELLHSVAHLGTFIEGRLAEAGGDHAAPRVLDLLAALHPTPAVGGTPRAQALEMIERLEAADRGRWAGPVGFMDAAGDGEWVIGIRSATVRPDGTRLCAGAGIVAGSDPKAELDETTVKLRPVLQALYPGAGELLNGAR